MRPTQVSEQTVGWPVSMRGIAEDALLGLAGRPVVVDLLVGAAGDAHPPAAALLLVDQHDAVLGPLVDRPRRAGGEAGRVEAVLAQPRQVHHEGLLELAVDLLLGHVLEVVVLGARGELAAEHVLPVARPLDLVHHLAGQQRARLGRRLRLELGRRLQPLVLEGVGLVEVVDLRQVRVGEDLRRGSATSRPGAARSCRSSCGPSRPASGPGSPSPSGSRCRAWSRRC